MNLKNGRNKTVAGEVFLDLTKVCEKNEDQIMAMRSAHFIVPGDVVGRAEG